MSAFAASEIGSCGVISQPGEYFLSGNLSSSAGNCLTFAVSSESPVELDCKGFSIIDKGLPGASRNAVQVNANSFTLKDCVVTGFQYAVLVDGAYEASIQGNTFTGQSKAAVRLQGSDSSNASYNAITGALALDLLDSDENVFQDNEAEGASFARLSISSNNAFSGGSFTSTESPSVEWEARLRHALMPGDDGSCTPEQCTIPPCPPVCSCVNGYRDCSDNARAVNISYGSNHNSFDEVSFAVNEGLGVISVIQVSSNSQGNSFTGCDFDSQALVQSHGAGTTFSGCDFNSISGLDFYGSGSTISGSSFSSSQGIVFYGADGKASGVESDGFVAFKSKGGFFSSSTLSGANAYFLAPASPAEEFARVDGVAAVKANLSNARVTWLNGEFEEAVFQDASARLKREWTVTLEFRDAFSPEEPVYAMLSLEDALGNSIYSSNVPVSSLELNLTEAVLSFGSAEFKGGRLRFSDFWDLGLHDPHSYLASAEGYSSASGEFSSSSGAISLIYLEPESGSPSTPAVTPPPMPSGMPGSFFTIEVPSSIVVNPQVTVYADLVIDGEGICSEELRLSTQLEGEASSEEYAPEACSNGRYVFILELSTPGKYMLRAYGYEDYTAFSSLRVVGQPPQAVPDVSEFAAALAGLLAFYALRRRD